MRFATITSVAALSLALAACATRQAANEEIVVTAANNAPGQNQAGALDKASEAEYARQEPVAPMPSPPPPPPPVAMMSVPVAPGLVGQSTRGYKIARDARAYVPSVVVPVDPGNERYDG